VWLVRGEGEGRKREEGGGERIGGLAKSE